MQKIFVATDRNGTAYTYTNKPVWQDSTGTFAGHWRFVDCDTSFAPPPGECREYYLVQAGEADVKDARIAELEKQLADRSPGVMPECVAKLLNAINRLGAIALSSDYVKSVRDHYAPPAGQPDRRGLQMRYRVLKADGSPADPRAKYFVLRLDWDGRDKEHVAACRKAAEAYILNAPDHMRQFSRELAEWVDLWPAGHEWQPVDDANPITAADVGRRVAFRHGGIGAVSEYRHHVPWAIRVDDIGFHASGPRIRGKISQHDITHILRPVAQPFVFDGTPGAYETDIGDIAHVVACGRGTLAVLNGGTWQCVLRDGTFDGGKITGRVCK